MAAQGGEVRKEHREKLIQWIHQLMSVKYRLKQQTLEHALLTLDLILSRIKLNLSSLQLVGIVCVMLAIKVEEGKDMPLSMAV